MSEQASEQNGYQAELDLWALPQVEEEVASEPEPEEEERELPVPVTAPAPAAPATRSTDSPAYEWIAHLMALPDDALPYTIKRHRTADGQILYEHPRGYPGVLVSLEAYWAGEYEALRLPDQRWFVVQWLRYDSTHDKPMPWRDEPTPPAKLAASSSKSSSPDQVATSGEYNGGKASSNGAQAGEGKKWEGGIRLRYRAVNTAYVHTVTGEGVFGESSFQAGSYPTLLALIRALPPEAERIYLVGPRPGRDGTPESLYLWMREPAVGLEWDVSKFEPDDDAPILELRSREIGDNGKKRELRFSRIAQWFGPGSYSPHQAQEAMQALERILQAVFDEKMRCLTTPGLTGLAAWDRSRKADYPVLDEKMQALIRHTSTQGRVEITPVPGRDPMEGFVYEDLRFAYGALLKGIGFAPATHDDVAEFDPRRRGRYLVKFRVPAGWDHIGLFAVKSDYYRDPWLYPATPGEEYETWIGSTELELGLHPPRGLPPWEITIKERLLFSNTSAGHPWPLDLWGDRLVEARLSIERRVAEGEFGAEIGELVENALRNILLHAIGGFHRRNRPELGIVYPHQGYDAIPADADPQFHSDGTVTYKIFKPLDKWVARLMHPEFSAQVWDRCRRHVLYSAKKKMGQVVPGSESGVLLLERKDIVGIRTDAAYLTRIPQGWPDDGKTPGQFRLKGVLREPCPQPDKTGKGHKLLNQLRDRSRRAWLAEQGQAATLITEEEER
jgi:hypothetical protein